MNVSSSTDYSSSDYEAQAIRLRAEMGVTIDELRCSLTPSKLASEAAARAGITERARTVAASAVSICSVYRDVVEPHEHVVAFVRRAAYCVAHDDDAVADINRVQYGRQHANIGLGSRDDQRVRLALAQMLDQPGFGETGIARFVDNGRGRPKRRQRRHQLQQPEIKDLAGRNAPARIVARHMPGIWSGRSGGMKRVKTVLSG